MPLKPISLLVAGKVPASEARETVKSEEEERCRVHPGDKALAAGALLVFTRWSEPCPLKRLRAKKKDVQ